MNHARDLQRETMYVDAKQFSSVIIFPLLQREAHPYPEFRSPHAIKMKRNQVPKYT